MSKYETLGVLKLDGEVFKPGDVIEMLDVVAAPMVKGGFLRLAPTDAAITESKKAVAAKKAKES
jgi:hypothetical protein